MNGGRAQCSHHTLLQDLTQPITSKSMFLVTVAPPRLGTRLELIFSLAQSSGESGVYMYAWNCEVGVQFHVAEIISYQP